MCHRLALTRVLGEPFAVDPEKREWASKCKWLAAVSKDHALPHYAARVAICLFDHAQEALAWPSMTTISSESSVHEKTAKQAIRKLCEGGYLHVYRHFNDRNAYEQAMTPRCASYLGKQRRDRLPNLYKLVLDGVASDAPPLLADRAIGGACTAPRTGGDGGVYSAPRGSLQPPNGGAYATPKPLSETIKEPTITMGGNGALKKHRFRDVTPEELADDELLRSRYAEAVAHGHVRPSEYTLLQVFATAERALRVANNPAAMWAAAIYRNDWAKNLPADEDRARRRIKRLIEDGYTLEGVA